MGTHRPFRFGTGAYLVKSRAELVALARKIEDLGYAICVTPDHFAPFLAPALHLVTVAEATRTLRIGSTVFDNDFRHPALLAKEVATLDLLSEGRFELGIGAGYMGPDYDTTHIPLDPPGVRVSRLIESVQIIKRLLAGEEVTFSGTYYQISGLKNYPSPVQTPYPPLYIAGGGKRMMTLAAREANIVGLIGRSGDGKIDFTDGIEAATAQRIQWIRETAGERFDSLELNTLVFNVTITDHRQQAAEQIAREWNLTSDQILNSLNFLVGTLEQIVETVQRWRELFGISYVIVVEEYLDIFAPVVARLAGR